MEGEFRIIKVRLMNGSRSAQSRVSSSAFVGFPFPKRLTAEHRKYHIPTGDLLWKESKGAFTVSESESEISF